jgi:WD40 repeat protein
MNASQTQPQAQAHTDVNSDQQSVANTRLHGRWLILARVVWLALVIFTLVFFFTGLLVYATHLREVCTSPATSWITSCRLGQLLTASVQVFHLSVESYGVFNVVLTLIWTLIWLSVAAVIFWRRSDDWMALLVALSLVVVGTGATEIGIGLSQVSWVGQSLNPFFQFLDTMSFVLVAFLFPTGRFVPRWTGWLTVALIALFGFQSFFPDLPINLDNWPLLLNTLAVLGVFGCLVFSQVYRYRHVSSPQQRQQTKWVVFAFSIVIVGIGAEVLGLEVLPQYFPALRLPDALYQVLDALAWQFSLILIPVSFGIAILRYRLWDIDVLINRTLVYGTLTVMLALVYFGLIIGLQSLVHLVTGTIAEQPLVIVASTLAIAALFQPFRRRIQTTIDRRFYRRKYDAARTIAAFSATLRGETDLNTLSEQLVAVVQETMQPTFVSLWLQRHDRQAQQQFGRLVTTVEPVPSLQPITPVSETEGTEALVEVPKLPSPTRVSRRAVLIGFAAGGVVVASGGLSWWLLKRRAFFTYRGHSDAAYDVAWSPNGKRIASTSKDMTVQIWDAVDGSHVFIYRGHRDEVYTAAWSPDGKRIASCSKDKTVQVWDAADGGHLFTYRGHKDAVILVAWSPDGKRLASGGGVLIEDGKPHDNTVQVWDATDGGHVFTYRGHTDGVQAVVWSPDGKRIASASLDKTVQVWDASDGGHVFTYRGHTDQVFTLAWSPDGKYLASGGPDKTVQIWNAADGDHVFTYTGHTDWVDGVAWSSDSTRIASASSDKTAQVWDAANGGHVFVYNGHTNYVVTTAWSPDGTRIATASYDDTVQIWSPA